MSYLPNKLERFMTSKSVRLNVVMQLVVHSLIFVVVACFGIYLYLSLLVIVVASLYLIFRLPMEKRMTRKEAEATTNDQVKAAEHAIKVWRQGDSTGAVKARDLLVQAWQVQFPEAKVPLWLTHAWTSPDSEVQERILQRYYQKSKEIDGALTSPYLTEVDRLMADDRQQALASEVIERLSSEMAAKSAATLQEALSNSYLLD